MLPTDVKEHTHSFLTHLLFLLGQVPRMALGGTKMKKIRDQPRATAQSSATVCFRATGPRPTHRTNCQIQNMDSGPAAPKLE